MSATEDDPQWLRNVNTRPGPDAGRSIDPTKPGPNSEGAQSDAELIAERDLLKRGAEAWRPMVEGLEKRIALLERYADSIAMWIERENVTDQERLSYIKGHPITRAAADRSVHSDLIPDCPTDGVAARQGNSG